MGLHPNNSLSMVYLFLILKFVLTFLEIVYKNRNKAVSVLVSLHILSSIIEIELFTPFRIF